MRGNVVKVTQPTGKELGLHPTSVWLWGPILGPPAMNSRGLTAQVPDSWDLWEIEVLRGQLWPSHPAPPWQTQFSSLQQDRGGTETPLIPLSSGFQTPWGWGWRSWTLGASNLRVPSSDSHPSSRISLPETILTRSPELLLYFRSQTVRRERG